MPKTTAAGAGDQGAPFSLPADLSTLTLEELTALHENATKEMDALLGKPDRSRADVPRLTELRDARNAIGARQSEMATEQAALDAEFDGFAAELATPAEPADGEVIEGEVVDAAPAPQAQAQGQPQQAPAPQLVTASGRPQGGAVTAHRELGGLAGPGARLNPSLSGARAAAPVQEAPAPEFDMTAVVASGRAQLSMGDKVKSLRSLGDLVEDRARNMSDQGGMRQTLPNDNAFRHAARRSSDPFGGQMIASIRNEFDVVFNDKTPVDVIAAYAEKLRSQASVREFESLVAAGGWCAPSQIRYDFFNIADQTGMIDLPTFGVERGGIQFPISPSLADTFSPALPWYTAFSNATVPWLWTEGDDILAATGSPTKPCIRVPCSTMDNRRLECYGICLTAGNLADNAWPESTANFLRLLMAAHYHAANARYISTISGLATQIATGCAAGQGLTAPLLSTAEMGAIDYRSKFGMSRDAVMEFVLPEWALGGVRADLAKRTGYASGNDSFRITDSDIASWFDARRIRVQFVQDYQVRAAGQPGAATAITAWPTMVKGLLYAPGTVARGNGMSLDLGVVRDSTLNRTNDFTAAWMEECHLIARFGHEVREYTINICADGTTGAADLTSCCP